MKVVGLILFIAFVFWSVFSLFVMVTINDYYKLMRSPGIIIIIVGYVGILAAFSIYKTLGKKWDENEYEYY